MPFAQRVGQCLSTTNPIKANLHLQPVGVLIAWFMGANSGRLSPQRVTKSTTRGALQPSKQKPHFRDVASWAIMPRLPYQLLDLLGIPYCRFVIFVCSLRNPLVFPPFAPRHFCWVPETLFSHHASPWLCSCHEEGGGCVLRSWRMLETWTVKLGPLIQL